MKICDIVQSFTARSGGIRTYIRAKQHYLADSGHEHVLIMPGARDCTRREGRTRVHEVASPHVPGYKPYRFNLRVSAVARILAEVRPDVIELASPYLMPWVAFRHRARHGGCRVVAYHHADFPTAYIGEPVASVLGRRAGRVARRAAEAYARRVYRDCDLVLTASPIFRRRLAALGITGLEELPLGVDLQLFHPGRRDRRLWDEIFPDESDGPILMYSGRLDREKQVEVLVAAHASLPPRLGARLFMVGEGPLRPMLQERAAVSPRLAVLPYVADRTRLAALLASADLYVTAGPFETFGLSVLEAQASGLPVVGVAAGALRDRVRPGLGALTPVGDAAAMAAAITDQLDCEPRSRGHLARAWVERDYDWSPVFDGLLDLYRGLAGRPAPVRSRPAAAVAKGLVGS